MEISWIESVIYGFIAGLTEILPVSSHAHQNIMQSLFGLTDGLAFLRFSVSVGAFVAFLFVAPLRKDAARISNQQNPAQKSFENGQYVVCI